MSLLWSLVTLLVAAIGTLIAYRVIVWVGGGVIAYALFSDRPKMGDQFLWAVATLTGIGVAYLFARRFLL